VDVFSRQLAKSRWLGLSNDDTCGYVPTGRVISVVRRGRVILVCKERILFRMGGGTGGVTIVLPPLVPVWIVGVVSTVAVLRQIAVPLVGLRVVRAMAGIGGVHGRAI
jgi:hypothetical protein